MYKYSTVTKEVQRLDSISCDKCKREFVLDGDDPYSDAGFEHQEMLKISHACGHRSRVAGGDGCYVEAQLCQDCWWELLGPFCRVSTQKGSN